MYFLFRPIKHLAPIRAWAMERGAEMRLSAETFELELTLGDIGIKLIPRFVIEVNGLPAYVRRFAPEGDFIGWMPYPSKQWPLSTDKRLFKEYALRNGLRVTASWREGPPLAQNYIVKPAIGSFGQGFQGPFGPHNPLPPGLELRQGEFFEQFIRGRSTKAWYWNGEPMALELLSAPTIRGDGRRPLRQIAEERRGNFDLALSLDSSVAMLAWQGYTPDSVPDDGVEVMLDFRYLTPYDRVTLKNRDVLQEASPDIAAQLAYAGPLLYAGIDPKVRENSVFTVDAVVDEADRVWFLEMNSHPMIHPNVYVPMLNSMFGLAGSPAIPPSNGQ